LVVKTGLEGARLRRAKRNRPEFHGTTPAKPGESQTVPVSPGFQPLPPKVSDTLFPSNTKDGARPARLASIARKTPDADLGGKGIRRFRRFSQILKTSGGEERSMRLISDPFLQSA
jgi:hypothetical protein